MSDKQALLSRNSKENSERNQRISQNTEKAAKSSIMVSENAITGGENLDQNMEKTIIGELL